ncbi:MAG: hypothetical protein IT430_03855, partial [Phycisphaerales bacterium]|nr:hypothetical protein [Phycisphaerales bacterium]
MASIIKDPQGQKRVAFTDREGRRRSIRLGQIDSRNAEAIRVRIEALVTASITGIEIDGETARWLTTISHRLHEKLSKAGMVASKETRGTTLGALLATYFNHLAVKSGTETCYKQARRSLEE